MCHNTDAHMISTRWSLIFVIGITIGCGPADTIDKQVDTPKLSMPELDLEEANRLISLPLDCIQKEYPNKLGQVLGDSGYLKSPKALHPAFYGCFDWHSAVHGHWSLVSLLKQFPDLDQREEAITMLKENINTKTIAQELLYFDDKYNSNYERTYGWAWLLKLAEELHTWDDPIARQLESNLQPLTTLIIGKYIEFLPKLYYPIRVGEHTNTGFGLSFAYDYARTVKHAQLIAALESRSKAFFLNDKDCPIDWEPSGYDFLSPCLEEAHLMSKVLPKAAFKSWVSDFMPQLLSPSFKLEVGKVSDRSDGKLVHLDGVNFSRAWCLFDIANKLGEADHLRNVAIQHVNHSLPSIVGDQYEGGHWLGSFAIYALNQGNIDE